MTSHFPTIRIVSEEVSCISESWSFPKKIFSALPRVRGPPISSGFSPYRSFFILSI